MGVAFLLGGTGQIGRAAAHVLTQDGREVVIASRSGTLPNGLAEVSLASEAARASEQPVLHVA